MRHRIVALLGIFFLLALLVAPTVGAQETNIIDGCVENYNPNVDYFPEKIDVHYARGFTVEYFNNYKVATVVTPWQGAEETFQYVLVQCGTPAPTGYENALQIDIPVKTIVTMSTTFLPYLDEQGLIDRLIGMDSFLFTNTPSVLKKIDDGQLVEVGGGGSGEPNIELLINLDPDLIMLQQFSVVFEFDTHNFLPVHTRKSARVDHVPSLS